MQTRRHSCGLLAEICQEFLSRYEIDSNSDDDNINPEVVPPSPKEVIGACLILEDDSLVVCTEGALELVQAAR